MVDDNLLGKIEEMAVDDNWRARDAAAYQIREINNRYFNDYYPVWKDWVRDENHFLRRAAEMGLVEVSSEEYDRAWELLEPLLYDENIYVRKSCGPVALSAVASRNPQATFRRFEELIRTQQNHNVRWNIAQCLGTDFGLERPREALRLLRELAADERRFVWRAAAAGVIKLLRRHPEYKREVFAWGGVKPALAVIKEYVQWPEEETVRTNQDE